MSSTPSTVRCARRWRPPAAANAALTLDQGDHGAQKAPAPKTPPAATAAPARPAGGQRGFATMSAAEFRAARKLVEDVPPRAVPGLEPPAGQGSIELGSARAAYGAPTPPAKPMQPEAVMQSLNEALLDILPDLPAAEPAPQQTLPPQGRGVGRTAAAASCRAYRKGRTAAPPRPQRRV